MGTGVWGPGQEWVAPSRSPGARRVLRPRPPRRTCRWSPAGMRGGPWGARLGLFAERASLAGGRAHRPLPCSCSSCRVMLRPQNALQAGLAPRAFHQLLERSQLTCPCSATQRCLPLCRPMDFSPLGSSALRCPPEFAHAHVHQVDAATPLSHPLPPPPASPAADSSLTTAPSSSQQTLRSGSLGSGGHGSPRACPHPPPGQELTSC